MEEQKFNPEEILTSKLKLFAIVCFDSSLFAELSVGLLISGYRFVIVTLLRSENKIFGLK